MRRLAITAFASCMLSLGLGQAASAADIPVKYRPAAVPVAWNWSGFYVGAHLGAGWARKEWSHRPSSFAPSCVLFQVFGDCDPSEPGLGSHNAIGVLGGVQAGFNWQFGAWVLGFEGQYSFADLKGNHENSFSAARGLQVPIGAPPGSAFDQFNENQRLSTNIKGIATIAGRIGLVSGPSDRTLFYVKGGAAYVREDFASAINASNLFCGPDCLLSSGNITGLLSASQSRWGWMVGTGLEFGLFDNWSAKVEYDYLDFGSKTVTLDGSGCFVSTNSCFTFSRNFDIDQTIHVVKIGINYRFGYVGPVVASY